jgi:2-keto-4-pentenoate hydratase/2-oxohepta-3-ene-1,7-dioic acid hydratase in catechol pathway
VKIICVGRNYSAHIAELNNERPTEPVLFMKPDTSLLQKNQPFFIPHFSQEIQYEVEIVVKIKKIGKHIEPKFAPKYYDEIGLGIDFTARTLQADLKAKGLPWEKAKAFDGSCLVSDWIDKNKFQNLKATAFSLQKNGKTVQEGNTAQMLWKIDELIAYCSTFFTLKIGDIIFTGTPEGVGPVTPNDTLEGFIESTSVFTLKIK